MLDRIVGSKIGSLGSDLFGGPDMDPIGSDRQNSLKKGDQIRSKNWLLNNCFKFDLSIYIEFLKWRISFRFKRMSS